MTWPCKPRTRAKLAILDGYLAAWFAIIAQRFRGAVYFDGFCGPGRYATGESGSALLAAKHATNVCERMPTFRPTLILNDSDPAALQNLNTELAQITVHRNVTVSILQQEFAESASATAIAEARRVKVPLFSFIDPFGIKDTPLSVVLSLLKLPSSEAFINFMGGWSNRFINHPDEQVALRVQELLGGDHAREVLAASDRIVVILEIYKAKLRSSAKFVRSFSLFDEGNVPDNFLIFCGNNSRGFVKMKEAMWKLDVVNGSRFSERTEMSRLAGQGELFMGGPQLGALPSDILRKLNDGPHSVATLRDWVEADTDYLAQHLRSTLTKFEEQRVLSIHDPQGDGRRRRVGTWPDRLILSLRAS